MNLNRQLIFNEDNIIELFTAMMCLGEIIGINNRLSKPMNITKIKISQYQQSKLVITMKVDRICKNVIERAKRVLQAKYNIPLAIEIKQTAMINEALKELLEKNLNLILLVTDESQTLILYPKSY